MMTMTVKVQAKEKEKAKEKTSKQRIEGGLTAIQAQTVSSILHLPSYWTQRQRQTQL
jgi:hypothetical protein